MKNVQGDVVSLVQVMSNGTAINPKEVAKYEYSDFGEITKVKALNSSGVLETNNANPDSSRNIAHLNPIRYRSYYYDTETGWYYLNSRYYDSETCRFLNADTITDGGAGVLGNNLFMYAANNPINNSDPSGHWIIKDAIKWIAKNVVKPAVKKVQKALSKVNITYTKDISGNFSPGIWSFNIQGGVSIDTKGNVAFQGTFAGGATANSSPTGSVGKFSMVTNAPSVNELNGSGYQIGGSVSIPIPPAPISISAGGEFNMIPNTKLNTNYYGITTFAGIAPPIPSFEVHAEWGQTESASFQFNGFNVMKNIYIKIMEW